MELQWTILQVLLVVGASLAQNFQNPQSFQSNFQPSDQQPLGDLGFQQPSQFLQQQPQQQRVAPQGGQFTGGDSRPQLQRPRRPGLEVQGVKSTPPRASPLQANQVQATQLSTQGFQNVPQQQVRSQPPAQQPVLRQPARPVARQPQPQQFQQPAQQPQQQQQFFDQPPQQQFQQPQQPQQFQQSFEPEPVVARRPQLEPLPVRRPQTQQQSLLSDGTRPLTDDQELIRQQALNAKYSFSTSVTDGINDNEHIREEVRDGLNLKGLYSYSDGFFKRTVHYEADENGYRVVKEEVDPLGDGPRSDPNGRADVSSNVGGNSLQYSITSADIPFVNSNEQQSQRQQQQPLKQHQQLTQQHQQLSQQHQQLSQQHQQLSQSAGFVQ